MSSRTARWVLSGQHVVIGIETVSGANLNVDVDAFAAPEGLPEGEDGADMCVFVFVS